MGKAINYHEALEALIEARATQIEPHLPTVAPSRCPGCGKRLKYAPYVDARRMWALHLAEETYRG